MHSIHSYSPLSSISINSSLQWPEKRADFPGNTKVWFLSFVHALFLVESDLLSLSRNKHLGVCTPYGIPSITFNSIQSINHRQLRPCRWQLVCLTSCDNSMIPSHSGPFFFFFFHFSFLSVRIRARFTRIVARPKRAKTGSYRTLHAIIK